MTDCGHSCKACLRKGGARGWNTKARSSQARGGPAGGTETLRAPRRARKLLSSLAARPLCWWLGEVSHPEPYPASIHPSAQTERNGEGGNSVPGRLGGGERDAGRGGAREAASILLVDGVARSARPKCTRMQRGKN